ncbi:MAG: hypothetical protein A2921_02980 [Candidatus Magasanikbacteria bacterium RIFCSPLOWO2_01_FULL_43_20b]|uniref:Uncharacterized protein n=1 Tax=Candidatus Magasanikbacteria bacterium RIFCSPLOWO2_12_FULL_43_12 TaxID=1798692 RepID=A0A1F6MV47_9BACT|nr:MAG: hypothetical protein A3C74_03285 [Candidatus Magasanikbacteria bacterium RIFCSPHIGHO2_02_FULL_44_13]OGH72629.1 MAG: hypothetical protein A3I93_01870 [Candidatus Magasanikbacteria bacterium RIFCSPLOWO2_02_FULL_43_22]OGH73599.1 MAG: hypothetical protein A2921_02980 [Candidatus Magasanikbacteria bacterium RIFCSPLOWO2_01_FULL_43_20b]OGH75565.1 MAG: hypothetical protein A3G00_00690 [Candidatus Magasanikbacteria bacterium RIFCSPLOWO2_12_FULL_43_12]
MGKKRPRRCAKCNANMQPNGRFCANGHLNGIGEPYAQHAQELILAGKNGFGQPIMTRDSSRVVVIPNTTW